MNRCAISSREGSQSFKRRIWVATDARVSASEQASGVFGRLEAEVAEGVRRRHAPARRALQEPALEQVGLVDVLDRVLLLLHGDRERREPDRAAAEALADDAE